MKIPGFSAEISLYKSNGRYQHQRPALRTISATPAAIPAIQFGYNRAIPLTISRMFDRFTRTTVWEKHTFRRAAPWERAGCSGGCADTPIGDSSIPCCWAKCCAFGWCISGAGCFAAAVHPEEE